MSNVCTFGQNLPILARLKRGKNSVYNTVLAGFPKLKDQTKSVGTNSSTYSMKISKSNGLC